MLTRLTLCHFRVRFFFDLRCETMKVLSSFAFSKSRLSGTRGADKSGELEIYDERKEC